VVRIATFVLGAAVCASAACGGRGFDARATVKKCGLECAADEVRYRLVTSPRDRDLYVALAEIEEERGRPGAAIEAYERAEKLGRAFRGGLREGEGKRLGALLVMRAEVRVTRGSPDADADLTKATRLGVKVPEPLVRGAALAAIAADLRHTDPQRRDRGRRRLALVDPKRAAALAGDATPVVLEDTALWLDEARAKRVMLEMLDAAVRRDGVDVLRDSPRAADRWLEARRWWGGPEGRPDLATLERVEAMGAGPCWYPRDHGPCDVIAAGGSSDPAGPSWEPVLFTHWERDGLRASTADEAAAWMIVARRAVARGQVASYARAVRDHVDVDAMTRDARLPRWAKDELEHLDDASASTGSAAGAGAGAGADDAAFAGRAWPDVAATLVAPDDAQRAALAAVADAYATDPALADRRAEDVLATAIDVAAAAPQLARLFALLGDPARARVLWQRAADASPEDAEIALGLALAMADAGDPAAGLVQMTRAAAAYGDAGLAMLRGAQGFGAAGHTVEALTLVRSALSLSAPGDEAPAAALAAALLDQMGRATDAASLRALAPIPSAWDGTDAARAVETASSASDLARLAALTRASDPATARLAARALRDKLGYDADRGVRARPR
jgi:hypothetical protein